jgi:hypothetical protein
MSCKKPIMKTRFQRGINPYTGCNERDFLAGNYIDEAVHALIRESLEAVLVPNGYALGEMGWRMQVRDPGDAIVRLNITPPAGPVEQHDIRVKDEGGTPWAKSVGPTLVAWVTDRYGL